jgi:hypothetical protein
MKLENTVTHEKNNYITNILQSWMGRMKQCRIKKEKTPMSLVVLYHQSRISV